MAVEWLVWPHRLKWNKPSTPRKHVKGGRWSIRKKPFNPQHISGPFIYSVGGKIKFEKEEKPWYAYVRQGKAKKWTRSFSTHAEAIRWATYVAYMHKMKLEDVIYWKDIQTLETIAQATRSFDRFPGIKAVAMTHDERMQRFIDEKIKEAEGIASLPTSLIRYDER